MDTFPQTQDTVVGRRIYVDALSASERSEQRDIHGRECAAAWRGPYRQLALSTIVSNLRVHQVNTYWNWGDVHRADTYLSELEKLRDDNATSAE